MDQQAPIRASVGDGADGVSKVVVITFQPDFSHQTLPEQAQAFEHYLQQLQGQIAAIADETDRDRAGMLIMLQFCQQLAPHISAGDLDLNEQIVLQVQRDDHENAPLIDFVSRVLN